jgi:hypothetical protein
MRRPLIPRDPTLIPRDPTLIPPTRRLFWLFERLLGYDGPDGM